jgi:hypothetical protein
MTSALPRLVFLAFAPLAGLQERPPDPAKPAPSDVIQQWNDAVAKRDVKTMARLAAKAIPKRALTILQQQSFLDYQGSTRIIHEEISGDRAVVVYRLENRGAVFTPEVRYDVATLVREGGQWKVLPNGGGVLKEGRPAKR